MLYWNSFISQKYSSTKIRGGKSEGKFLIVRIRLLIIVPRVKPTKHCWPCYQFRRRHRRMRVGRHLKGEHTLPGRAGRPSRQPLRSQGAGARRSLKARRSIGARGGAGAGAGALRAAGTRCAHGRRTARCNRRCQRCTRLRNTLLRAACRTSGRRPARLAPGARRRAAFSVRRPGRYGLRAGLLCKTENSLHNLSGSGRFPILSTAVLKVGYFPPVVFTVKTKTAFWGMLYFFWVWNQNGGGMHFGYFSR